MLPRNRISTHPGEIVQENMDALGWDVETFANRLGIDEALLRSIINANHPITADVSIRLAKLFNVDPRFYMNMQSAYDITVCMNNAGHHYDRVMPLTDGERAEEWKTL